MTKAKAKTVKTTKSVQAVKQGSVPQHQVILVISDQHFPYSHADIIPFLTKVKEVYKPNHIVNIGDETDSHAVSFHDSDPDLMSAGDELEAAILKMQPLYKLFPKMDILESNHGSLNIRKAMASGLPRAAIKEYQDVLRAPKTWIWHESLIIQTRLGPVFFCHNRARSALKNSQMIGMSFVQGHHHSTAEISYWSSPERLLFGVTVGCLIDGKSRAFAYNKLQLARPVLSVAVIVNGVPALIPMILDGKGRWIGKL